MHNKAQQILNGMEISKNQCATANGYSVFVDEQSSI